jgi:hypothetical protein
MISLSRHGGDRKDELGRSISGRRPEGGRRPRRTHWDAIGVFLSDTLRLSFALLKGMLVLKLRSHFQGRCLGGVFAAVLKLLLGKMGAGWVAGGYL